MVPFVTVTSERLKPVTCSLKVKLTLIELELVKDAASILSVGNVES